MLGLAIPDSHESSWSGLTPAFFAANSGDMPADRLAQISSAGLGVASTRAMVFACCYQV
jgi:hypothetical protein